MVHHRLSNYLLSLAIAGLGFIANATPIFAHAVETNYELNLLTKELQLTATYSTGEALEFADVQVFAPNQPDRPWLSAKTDRQGRFNFRPDRQLPGEWMILINQQGHADILKVPVDSQGVQLEKISFGEKLDIHLPFGELVIHPWMAQIKQPNLPIYLMGWESQTKQLIAYVKLHQFSIGIMFSWLNS